MVRDSTEAKRCQGCGTEYYSTHPTECDECIEHEARECRRLPANTPIHLSEGSWQAIASGVRWHLEGKVKHPTYGSAQLPQWFKPTEDELETARLFVNIVDEIFPAKSERERVVEWNRIVEWEEWEDAQ